MVAGVVKFQSNSAPPNGVGTAFCVPAYKHLTPNGVKTGSVKEKLQLRIKS